MSKTFCIAPWQTVHAVTSGDILGCCMMGQGPNLGRLYKDGKHLNVTAGLDNVLSNETSNDIRKTMLEGKWHPECISCHNEEKSSMRSMRTKYNEHWEQRFNIHDARKITNEDGSLLDGHEPFFYDLQLGNLCNLKCRICNPMSSSAWIPDALKMNGIEQGSSFEYQTPTNGVVQVKHKGGKQFEMTPNLFAWVESKEFWDDLSARKHSIEQIDLIGGEPTLIKRHYDFLRDCIESGDSKHIVIQYTTNLTNMPEELYSYLEHFQTVEIKFSIDGIGKALEYQRNPLKWNMLLANIERLEKFAVESKNARIFDATTSNVYNVLHMLDYTEWKIKQGRYHFKELWQIHNGNLNTHLVHHPDYLSIKVLPHSAKVEIEKQYRDWEKRMVRWIDNEGSYTDQQTPEELKQSVQRFVTNWISYMYQEDLSDRFGEFWSYTQTLDQMREEKFEDVFPDLYELIKDYV